MNARRAPLCLCQHHLLLLLQWCELFGRNFTIARAPEREKNARTKIFWPRNVIWREHDRKTRSEVLWVNLTLPLVHAALQFAA
jgi:hypothetical protein